jgi:1,4-dihydroxy-2-naphthoate octaprenyltransferase
MTGPYPLGYIGLGNLSIGYSGLGDLFVFLYFGVVATITVPYLYLRKHEKIELSFLNLVTQNEIMRTSLLVSLPIGFLGTAIIAVNNLRDRVTDVHAGKRTMAVRFGEKFTRIEYIVLVLGSYVMLVPISNTKLGKDFLWILAITFPMVVKELKAVGFGGKDGGALNDHVGSTARLQAAFCCLLAVAFRFNNTTD